MTWWSASARSARTLPRLRGAGNWLLARFASYVAQMDIADLTSGFRAMRLEVIREFVHLLPNRYSWPTTSLLCFAKAGYSVAFVPIEARRRAGGRSGQKLFRNGFKFMTIILRIVMLFSPLRVFVPISLLMFVLSLVAYAASVFVNGVWLKSLAPRLLCLPARSLYSCSVCWPSKSSRSASGGVIERPDQQSVVALYAGIKVRSRDTICRQFGSLACSLVSAPRLAHNAAPARPGPADLGAGHQRSGAGMANAAGHGSVAAAAGDRAGGAVVDPQGRALADDPQGLAYPASPADRHRALFGRHIHGRRHSRAGRRCRQGVVPARAGCSAGDRPRQLCGRSPVRPWCVGRAGRDGHLLLLECPAWEQDSMW